MKLALLFWLLAVPSQFPELARQAAGARERNNAEEAIKLYRECVRLRPAWAEGWWYLGTLLYDRDAYAGGRDALTHFVHLEAKSATGWAMLGLCEYQTRQYEPSLEHLQRAESLGLVRNPEIANTSQYHIALLLTHFGQFEAALQILLRLAPQDPDSPTGTAAAGIAALRMPLLPAELSEAKREIVYQVGRAVIDTAARRPAPARREFEELAAKYPDTPEIHYLYGGFLVLSDPDAAIREWKRELEISPRHVPARLQLAYEYLKRGDAAAGLPYAEEAVKLEAGSFTTHNALGRLLIEKDDLPRGIAELEIACKLAPESPENRVALASAYAKAGRKEDAARERAEFLRLKKLAQ